MPFGAVLEVLGTIRREDREVRVVLVGHDEGKYVRLESRRLQGGRWSPGRTLALRTDEAQGVIDALAKAIEAVKLEPGKRRKLNDLRRKLRAHDKAFGHEDWRGRTRRQD